MHTPMTPSWAKLPDPVRRAIRRQHPDLVLEASKPRAHPRTIPPAPQATVDAQEAWILMPGLVLKSWNKMMASKTRRAAQTAQKAEARAAVAAALEGARTRAGGVPRVATPCTIKVVQVQPRKHAALRDPDNLCPKAVIDEIVAAGIIPKDTAEHVLAVDKRIRYGNTAVLVVVKAADPCGLDFSLAKEIDQT